MLTTRPYLVQAIGCCDESDILWVCVFVVGACQCSGPVRTVFLSILALSLGGAFRRRGPSTISRCWRHGAVVPWVGPRSLPLANKPATTVFISATDWSVPAWPLGQHVFPLWQCRTGWRRQGHHMCCEMAKVRVPCEWCLVYGGRKRAQDHNGWTK